MKKVWLSNRGLTLLELLVILMVLSLVLTAAVKTWDVTLERARYESTRHRLDQLVGVIIGDPDQTVNGQRVDFGYVGDVGLLPDGLVDLTTDPTGLPPDSSTWQGPYIRATFDESPAMYRYDGWGDTLIYRPDTALAIRSLGGAGLVEPDRWLTREIGYSPRELLRNTVEGRMLDIRGLSPGQLVVDHPLRFPGAVLEMPVNGRLRTVVASIDTAGRFVFADTVPQGVRLLRVTYLSETANGIDTIVAQRYVTVYPKVGARDIDVHLDVNWENE